MIYSRFSVVGALFLCLSLSLPLAAQEHEGSSRKLARQADNLILNENYRQAAPLFKQLLEKDPNEAHYAFSLGVCYLHLPPNPQTGISKEKALKLLEQAHGKVEMIDATYYLARAYHINYLFEKAIEHYKLYLKKLQGREPEMAYPFLQRADIMAEIRKRMARAENGLELIKDTVAVEYFNMGSTINSPYEDYAPTVSADDEVLVFTSRRPSNEEEKPDYDYKYDEDIYITMKENGVWMPCKPILGDVNTRKHDASIGLSVDAQKLFVYHKGDIYYSDLEGNHWTEPIGFGKEVNSVWLETHISMNAARNVIYFVSDRNGGYGGKDIYSAKLQPDGNWGEVTNLGPTVNTKDDEDGPFIHPDDKQLYFSSTGHNSMGGYDIFQASLDDKGRWSKPTNLGFPINTPEDDVFFTVSSNGKSGYLASIRADGVGEKDIYKARLSAEGEVPLTVVRGIIRGSHGKPMQAQFKVRNGETGELIGIYKSNAVTGKYLLVFPPGRKYDILVSADHYIPHFERVMIPAQDRFYDLFQEVQLSPAKGVTEDGDTLGGQQIVFRNAFFDIDSAVALTDASLAEKDVKEVIYSTFVGWLDDPGKKAAIAKQVEGVSGMDGLFSYKPETQVHIMRNEAPDGLQQEGFGFDTVWATSTQSKTLATPENDELALVTETPHYVTDEELDTTKNNVDAILALKKVDEALNDLTKNKSWLANPDVALAGEAEKQNPDALLASQSNQAVMPEAEAGRTATTAGKTSSGSGGLLARVLFDFDGSRLREESRRNLDKVAELLKKQPDLSIDVSGFTCTRGDETYNRKLSEERCRSVKTYLEAKGITKDRMTIRGLGEEHPAAPNHAEENMARNRRAEITAHGAVADWKVLEDNHTGTLATESGEADEVRMPLPLATAGVPDAAICTGVSNRTPQQPGTQFGSEQGKLYCFTKVNMGGTASGTIHHKWYFGDQLMADVELQAKGSAWRTWSSKKIMDHWKGDWRVEITLDDGTILKTEHFTLN